VVQKESVLTFLRGAKLANPLKSKHFNSAAEANVFPSADK
jgi:hypothetical protein